MSILITGGSGLVGRRLVSRLAQSERRVRVMSRRAEQLGSLAMRPSVEVVSGDLCNRASLDAALEGVTKVVHAAALISLWRHEAEAMHRVNVEGTATLLAACADRALDRFVHVGALSSVGKPCNPEITRVEETTATTLSDCSGPYLETKRQAEQLVLQAADAGLPAVTLIPPMIIGPGGWDESSVAMFKLVRDGFPFYTDAAISAVGLDDFARIVEQVLCGPLPPRRRYFVLAETLSMRELLGQIATSLGRKPPRLPMPSRLLAIVGAMLEAWSKISGKRPLLTIDGVHVLTHKPSYDYDGSQIIQDLGVVYTPIAEVIDDTGRKLLAAEATEA